MVFCALKFHVHALYSKINSNVPLIFCQGYSPAVSVPLKAVKIVRDIEDRLQGKHHQKTKGLSLSVEGQVNAVIRVNNLCMQRLYLQTSDNSPSSKKGTIYLSIHIPKRLLSLKYNIILIHFKPVR